MACHFQWFSWAQGKFFTYPSISSPVCSLISIVSLGAIYELLHLVLISMFAMIGNPSKKCIGHGAAGSGSLGGGTTGFILGSTLRNYSCFLGEPDEEPDEWTEYRSAVCKTSALAIVLSLSHTDNYKHTHEFI